jgi:hypothetical protein
MERNAAITSAMRLAVEEFRREFRLAHLDPLKAVDMSRVRVDNVREHDAALLFEAPRRRVILPSLNRSVRRSIAATSA